MLFSGEVYKEVDFFKQFNPSEAFTKWAAVEVASAANIPLGLETLEVPEGLYAVFTYVGNPAEATPFYTYIFTQWLPASGFVLDNRPHFAIMGTKYRNGDPTSEEEICIPVRRA